MIAPLGENVLLLKMLLASNGIVVLEKQQHISSTQKVQRRIYLENHKYLAQMQGNPYKIAAVG